MNFKEKFIEIYGENDKPIRCFAASGRVNIIGEHIDYNGGNVFPAALNLGCFIYARENNQKAMNIAFTTTDKQDTIKFDKLEKYKMAPYINYQAGVLHTLKKEGVPLVGVDVLYDITVPFGSGLSSSAAIEVATAYMQIKLYFEKIGETRDIDLVKIATISQKAENQYIGVNCGIMDQFASSMGKKDKAILLDCSNLDYSYVDFNTGDYSLIIVDTNKPHSLVTSKYNERREECNKALELLKTKRPEIKNICDLTVPEFEEIDSVLEDEKLYKRAAHCVKEQARVLKAAEAMKTGDMETLGALLHLSHESLKNMYEVSCSELDAIVNIADEFDGCCGARMTGAGFGGSCIALVKKDKIEEFSRVVKKEYVKTTGLECSVYVTNIEDGAREIILE